MSDTISNVIAFVLAVGLDMLIFFVLRWSPPKLPGTGYLTSILTGLVIYAVSKAIVVSVEAAVIYVKSLVRKDGKG